MSRATTQALSPEENAMDSLLSSSPSPTTQPGSSLTMVAFGMVHGRATWLMINVSHINIIIMIHILINIDI